MWPVGAVAPGSNRLPDARPGPIRGVAPAALAASFRLVAQFRDAIAADAAAIAAVQVAAWRVAYRGLLPDAALARLSVADGTERWAEILGAGAPRTTTVLAVDGGEVVGFAATGPAPGADDPALGRLYAIYLAPWTVGTGLGHRLHAAATDRLRAAGFTAAELWVLRGNARALRFYHREGWVDTGRTQVEIGPAGDRRDELCLRLDLTTPPAR
jgi:ribosomal protein S18 acetylase RimI-like enzyme